MAATTTSLRLPNEVRDIYDTLVRATGRSRNDLMVEALRVVGERQLREIALVQEGQDQIRAGLGILLDDLEAELRRDEMLREEANQTSV